MPEIAGAASLRCNSFGAMLRAGKLAAVTYQVATPPAQGRYPRQRMAPHLLTAPNYMRSRGEWGLKFSRPPQSVDSDALGNGTTVIVSSFDQGPAGFKGAIRSGSHELQEFLRFRDVFGYNEVIPLMQADVNGFLERASEKQSVSNSPTIRKKSESYSRAYVTTMAESRGDVVHLDSLGRKAYLNLLRFARYARAKYNADKSDAKALEHMDSLMRQISNTRYVRYVHPPLYLVTGPRRDSGWHDVTSITSPKFKTQQDASSVIRTNLVPPSTAKAYILNYDNDRKNSLIIGMSGFTARLPIEAISLEMSPASSELNVAINSVTFDPKARPDIEVSRKVDGSRMKDAGPTPISASGRKEGNFSWFKKAGSSAASAEKFRKEKGKGESITGLLTILHNGLTGKEKE